MLKFSVWALRARSYKTRAEAYQQGIALHPLQGVYLVFVLLQEIGSRSSKVQKVQEVQWVQIRPIRLIRDRIESREQGFLLFLSYGHHKSTLMKNPSCGVLPSRQRLLFELYTEGVAPGYYLVVPSRHQSACGY